MGGEMRVAPQILDRRDRRESDADALAARLDLGAGEFAERLADSGHEPVARLDAIGIALETIIGAEIGPLEDLAEALPQRVAGRGDENVLAIGGLEYLIDAQAGPRSGIGSTWSMRL